MPIPIDATPTEGNGEVVIVEVVDPRGRPVSTATVRHPDERIAHRVHARTGRWRVEQLYLDAGPAPIRAGGTLELEVRAPGYVPINVSYEVWARRNVVVVALSPLGATVSDRSGQRFVAPDWDELAAGLEWVTADAEPVFTPAFVQSLGTSDPLAAGTMALALAKQGPTQATAAYEWASEALRRGRILEGDAYVELTDHMLAVRALSAMADWQLSELERLATGEVDPEGPRRLAEGTAAEWLEYTRAAGTDGALALTLCRSSSLSRSRCE